MLTSLPKGHKFDATSPPVDYAEQYRRLIGRLLYLNLTRPDFTYKVQHLSQFVASPCNIHLHVIKYLKGTSTMGLFYSSTFTFDIATYCDSDWVSCLRPRRSPSRYCVLLGSIAIS